MCFGCTANGKIVWSFILAAVCIASSITLGVIWPDLTKGLIENELKLTQYTTMYKNWQERPIPIYFEIYMFNWSNVENVNNWQTEKPHFSQMGPYVFEESARRVDINYTDNGNLIGFNTEKTWKFRQDLSNGTLGDRVFNLNPVAAVGSECHTEKVLCVH